MSQTYALPRSINIQQGQEDTPRSKPFILNINQKEKTKELLRYCVALRDFVLQDKYISPEDLQLWEIAKCRFMYREHNMMEVLVSELYRLRGYERRADLIDSNGTTSQSGLMALYNEVNQALQDLKTETLKLQTVYENSKRLHWIEITSNVNNIVKPNFTPVELAFLQFSDLAEKIVFLNETVVEPIIRNITRSSN